MEQLRKLGATIVDGLPGLLSRPVQAGRIAKVCTVKREHGFDNARVKRSGG
jgi:hypothetical protein